MPSRLADFPDWRCCMACCTSSSVDGVSNWVTCSSNNCGRLCAVNRCVNFCLSNECSLESNPAKLRWKFSRIPETLVTGVFKILRLSIRESMRTWVLMRPREPLVIVYPYLEYIRLLPNNFVLACCLSLSRNSRLILFAQGKSCRFSACLKDWIILSSLGRLARICCDFCVYST